MKLLTIPSAEYHRDLTGPTLTKSIAHVMLSRSPMHAYLAHPRLGGKANEPTSAMERGTVIHDLLLKGGTLESVEVIDQDSYRTKAAQDHRDAARRAGRVPILAHELDSHRIAADAIRGQLSLRDICFDGQTEGVAFWDEYDDAGKIVKCRGMFDHWQSPIIDDLKTTACAHPDACLKSIFSFGYDIHAAAYISGAKKLFPEVADAIKFRLIFVELDPPYLLTIVEPDDSILAIGHSKWRRAINAWSESIRTGVWGGYWDGVYTATARPWHLRDELELTADTASIMKFLDMEIEV